MGLEKQGAKPKGIVGKMIGLLMNRYHTPFYQKYFQANPLPPEAITLDLGCGGGRFLHSLSNEHSLKHLIGLDHSMEMARLARKTNVKSSSQNLVSIINASVTNIPCADRSIDVITALETIQFWPKMDFALKEIFRILKKRFVIINRYPPEGSKWWKSAQLKNEADYHNALKSKGFNNITTNLAERKGWIVVEANK